MNKLLALLVFVLGCDGCGERPGSTESPSTETPTTRSEGNVGTVRGIVRIAEGQSPPEYPEAALQGMGPPGDPPEECPPLDGRQRQPVTLEEGGLVGVMVSATGDPETFFEALGEWEPTAHEVVIRDCRLQPALVVAARNDTLTIKNENTYPFMLAVGRTSFMEALLPNQPKEITLDEGGTQAIRCGFAAPCGRTDVVTVFHPVHAVTEAGGRFELTNVPRGQEVEIHAWHPLFRDSSVKVTIEGDEVPEIELTIEPAEIQVPEPREPVPGEPF